MMCLADKWRMGAVLHNEDLIHLIKLFQKVIKNSRLNRIEIQWKYRK